MNEEAMEELWERLWDDDWIDDDISQYLPGKEVSADDGSSCAHGSEAELRKEMSFDKRPNIFCFLIFYSCRLCPVRRLFG